MTPKRIVILISGRGSNMQAIIERAQQERWPAYIAAVISNRAQAQGLRFAANHHIPTEIVSHKDYPSREKFDTALSMQIDHYRPDLVVLAGFMRILTPRFVHHYAGRLINIHPSLLPSFPGMATHTQALQYGVKLHGATVHFVTTALDHGPIIAQAAVPVLDDDTEATLAARVLKVEHRIYPKAVRDVIEGKALVRQA